MLLTIAYNFIQTLLNAHENPQYTAIQAATFGLVFFGCPHRGAEGVELGMIAARVARFVSGGRASNELLECLRNNSLFTRQMLDWFSHQLLNYQVLSFIEGKPMRLEDFGPASVSHVSKLLYKTAAKLPIDANYLGTDSS